MIRYLRGTPDLALTIYASSPPILKWWVDRSVGVQPNMKGHPGGCISLVKGMIITGSNKKY